MNPLPGRRRAGATLAAAAWLASSGCLGPDPDGGSYLRFGNPEITAGLDSLRITGINAVKRDTVPIRLWRKGQDFPSQVPYPPGLESAFTLLAQGFKEDELVYQSRTLVSGGHAEGPVHDFRLVAPALPDLPATLAARVADALVLRPAWEARPGIYRRPDSAAAEVFSPEAVFAWTRDGRIVGRDSVLEFGALAFADSGAYLFSAANRAGQDSMIFILKIRHMLPRIAEIKPQAALAGRSLSVKPSIAHSDSLLFRWTKNGAAASEDSVLSFAALGAQDTGTYQLAVANASDTTETAVSNHFAVALAPDPNAAWKPEKSFTAGAQDNSSYGTSIDLDATTTPLALFYSVAAQNQPALDLLFVYSGGALKLMSPAAAKRATDFDYAHGFDDKQIKDVKFVKAASKPATPAQGRALYDAGPQVDASAVAQGQGFLVKTSDANLAWLKIEAIHGGAASSASADFTVATAPY